MCFKNLPVDFDANGKASLRGGIPNPWDIAGAGPVGVPKQLSAEDVEKLVRRNGHVRDVDFDPVTRVAGALASIRDGLRAVDGTLGAVIEGVSRQDGR